VCALATTFLFFFILSGYGFWHAGSSLGNRYLLPLLFFAGMALPPALQSARSRGLFVVAACFSVLSHFLAGLSWPHFPAQVAWPIATASAWFLAHGWIAPSLASAIHAPVAVELLVPVAILFTTGLAGLATALRTRPQRGMATGLGGLAFAAMLLLVPRAPFDVRLWRAAYFGSYSGRDPAREELRRAANSALNEEERERGRRALERARSSPP
jgi:hypothetical protein